METTQELLTVEQAAILLHMAVGTVKKDVKSGKLPALMIRRGNNRHIVRIEKRTILAILTPVKAK